MRRRVRGVTGAAAAAALVAGALLATSPVAAQAQGVKPTFVNGLAQDVFSTNPADWYSGEVWVQAPFDSDGDGRADRIHADFTAPGEVLTDGLKVPVIFEDSPYYAGLNDAANWGVDHPLGQPPASRVTTPFQAGRETSPVISTVYESRWVPRGVAVVPAESPGTGHSDGCPTSGGSNETLAGKAVIDWLNGRVPAYTTRDGDTPAVASWTTGKVGMMGTSYNGTIPEAVATTGVQGLEAIVPISAISDWYDYYRANGMVRAPGTFQGEDLDVLADAVYSRLDETTQRTICQPVLDELAAKEDRATGDRSAFWQERNYMKDVQNVHAATLVAHGNNDFNVMTKNAAQFYDALKKQGVPHMFYFHQGGHGGAPPDVLINYWFTRYLYGVENGVEQLPRSWVVREPASCPARQSAVTGDQANTATLTVADTSAFRIGFTLTVPQTNANGTTTNTTRLISNIPDGTHLVLSTAVATGAGQKVAGGTIVNLVCGTANP
ncbi:MAG: X-Pro dipeptidyl-peptidase, partial [Kribbellaceae bacterium]|nr:X-Pro dipeptidyl-peptidase [Kribbellaceae bacterium]